MSTSDKYASLRKEIEELSAKLSTLTNEELALVSGGVNASPTLPSGLNATNETSHTVVTPIDS